MKLLCCSVFGCKSVQNVKNSSSYFSEFSNKHVNKLYSSASGLLVHRQKHLIYAVSRHSSVKNTLYWVFVAYNRICQCSPYSISPHCACAFSSYPLRFSSSSFHALENMTDTALSLDDSDTRCLNFINCGALVEVEALFAGMVSVIQAQVEVLCRTCIVCRGILNYLQLGYHEVVGVLLLDLSAVEVMFRLQDFVIYLVITTRNVHDLPSCTSTVL
jgi:hypothetical protein